jgi:hypothetical protein
MITFLIRLRLLSLILKGARIATAQSK